MKFLFILLFSVSLYAQDTLVKPKQSVIGLDKLNVVYRGIENPISIAVNNAKSYKINGLGVRKDEKGNYTIVPGRGLTTKIYVEITQNDDTVIVEEHEFRIKDLHAPVGLIDGKYSIVKMSKKEFINSKITFVIPDLFFAFKYEDIISFDIILSKKKTYHVEGNLVPEFILKDLKKNHFLKIDNIRINTLGFVDRPKINGIEVYIYE